MCPLIIILIAVRTTVAGQCTMAVDEKTPLIDVQGSVNSITSGAANGVANVVTSRVLGGVSGQLSGRKRQKAAKRLPLRIKGGQPADPGAFEGDVELCVGEQPMAGGGDPSHGLRCPSQSRAKESIERIDVSNNGSVDPVAVKWAEQCAAKLTEINEQAVKLHLKAVTERTVAFDVTNSASKSFDKFLGSNEEVLLCFKAHGFFEIDGLVPPPSLTGFLDPGRAVIALTCSGKEESAKRHRVLMITSEEEAEYHGKEQAYCEAEHFTLVQKTESSAYSVQHRAAESFLSINDCEIAHVVARREVVHSGNQAYRSPPKPPPESCCKGCGDCFCEDCCDCRPYDSNASWSLSTWSIKGEYVSDGSNLIDRTVQDDEVNMPMITVILEGDSTSLNNSELAALKEDLRDKLADRVDASNASNASNGQFDKTLVSVTFSREKPEFEAKAFFMPGSGVDIDKARVIADAIGNPVTANSGRTEYRINSASAGHSTPPPEVIKMPPQAIEVHEEAAVFMTLRSGHAFGIRATTDTHSSDIFKFASLVNFGTSFQAPPAESQHMFYLNPSRYDSQKAVFRKLVTPMRWDCLPGRRCATTLCIISLLASLVVVFLEWQRPDLFRG